MRKPIIALLTDFGTSDSYVASMKGVILSLARDATCVDISHEVPPHDVARAAYLLWSTFRSFPRNTVFVCVVDPGVGTTRDILCVEGEGYRFLAPDNRVLQLVLGSLRNPRAVVVRKPHYFKNASRTFHGRDVFAPVAARLSRGIPIRSLGPEKELEVPPERFTLVDTAGPGAYEGDIVDVDRFGNIITSFLIRNAVERKPLLRIGRRTVTRYEETYSAGSNSAPFMIVGSSDLLEISVNTGSAARLLGAKINARLRLEIS